MGTSLQGIHCSVKIWMLLMNIHWQIYKHLWGKWKRIIRGIWVVSNWSIHNRTFNIQVRYRRHANFHIQEQDSSARFIDLDQQYFMPTITKFAKRSPPPPPWPNASPSPPPSSRHNNTSPEERHQRPSSSSSPSTAVVIPPPPPPRISDRPHTAPFKSPSSLSSSSNVCKWKLCLEWWRTYVAY